MKYYLNILIITLSATLLLGGTRLKPVQLLNSAFAQFWTGKTASGTVITEEDLARILANHKKWLETDRKGGEKANLSWAADLIHANLSGANLRGTFLRGTIFEPLPNLLPAVDSIANGRGLAELWYENSPQSLAKLRKAFKEAGYRQQERELTCSLKHSDTFQDWQKGGMARIKAAFNYVFFDQTCN
jgi:hypothetical protein